MRYWLVLVLILGVVGSTLAADFDFFGKVEGRIRYDMDTKKNNTSTDTLGVKEVKYSDLSALYAGVLGVDAKFRNSLNARLAAGLDGPANLNKAPSAASLILDEAAVYYDNDVWMFAIGKYAEGAHSVKALHYNPIEPANFYWATNKRAMIGVSPGFRVNKNIKFQALTDVIFNTHGSKTSYYTGDDSENPSKDQWVVGLKIPMKFIDKDALKIEPIVLFSTEGIISGEGNYIKVPSRLTFGADVKFLVSPNIKMSIGGAMTSCKLDEEADTVKNIARIFYEDAGMSIRGGFAIKDAGPGTFKVDVEYDTWKITTEDPEDSTKKVDHTRSVFFVRTEYPIILGRLSTSNDKKRKKTQIYLKPRLRLWFRWWDPNDYSDAISDPNLDQYDLIRPELIIGAKF